MNKIANGTFTLIWPDGDRHRTFKIRTQKPDAEFAPGQRIISLMTGRDNESDYTSFGFIDESGVHIWNSAKQKPVYHNGKLAIWVTVLQDLAIYGEKSKYHNKGMTLKVSERCIVCNRKLTNPESIRSKIGPECSKRRAI